MSNIQDSTNSIQEEWETYTQKIDAQYIEDSTVVESVNDGLEEGLRHWYDQFHDIMTIEIDFIMCTHFYFFFLI